MLDVYKAKIEELEAEIEAWKLRTENEKSRVEKVRLALATVDLQLIEFLLHRSGAILLNVRKSIKEREPTYGERRRILPKHVGTQKK
jgi:hypothetical protein